MKHRDKDDKAPDKEGFYSNVNMANIKLRNKKSRTPYFVC